MPILTRLLTLIAATFIVAQPVLACPLMIGAGVAAPSEISTAHPCHDMAMEAAGQDNHQQDSSSDCPAGFDCAPMLIQAQSETTPIAPNADPAPALPVILAAAPVSFPPERPARSTGLPPNAVLPPETPVSLKQRALN